MFGADRSDPRGFPILGDHSDAPPTIVVTASLDPIRDSGRAYAKALVDAGRDCVFIEMRGVTHSFTNLRAAVPSTQRDLERIVADGRYTRLFLARDMLGDAGAVVLKFPKPAVVSEHGARTAFLREAFIGRRIDSPFVGKVLSLDAGRQSRLYIAQPFHAGQTLHARLAQEGPFEIGEGIGVALRLSRAVSALHRAGVTHRDIKPDNVILETQGGLKLVDLGVARLRLAEEFAEAEAPGTAGYKAPEMYAGESGDAATDQFALGVTLYRLFTRTYPWGEVDPADAPRFDRAPAPPTRHRPDMPAWLEAAIMRAVAVDPNERFEDVEELIHVLETGSAVAAPPPRQLSLIERDPVRFWQGISLVLLIAFLVSMATH